MVVHLHALVIDALDPEALARFWGGVLGREVVDDDGPALAAQGREVPVRFEATDRPRLGPNQIHLDLTSRSLEHQRDLVERALSLGGSLLDVGQLPEDEHEVLADPEGNEFCVIEPGNRFLAGTGTIGALSSDGTAAVGRFWSAALGWPLVWDQDEETAVQPPEGGSKISWGGPPLAERQGPSRFRLDVVTAADDDLAAEAERLVGLGATRLDVEERPGRVALADPDGNPFGLLAPR